MECQVWDHEAGSLVRVEDREPECGEDFCDACGDCLSCYAEDPCLVSCDGRHVWNVSVGRPTPPQAPGE